MKMNQYIGLLILLLYVVPKTVQSGSKIEFQPGTHLEVQSGVNISADNIIVNGTFSGGGTLNNGPLPVEITSFIASSSQNAVELRWNTATEVQNYGFEIERQTIGASGVWGKIAFVPGAGTSNSAHDYTFADRNLSPGKYAYRIKQIDRAGSFKYYGNAEVEILAPLTFTLGQNYPNPFNPSTIISFGIPEGVFVSLNVFDLVGREVATLVSQELQAGFHSFQWNAANMPSGVYLYRMQAGSFSETKKLVILK